MNFKNVFAATLIAGLISGSAHAQTGTGTDSTAGKKMESKDANHCNSNDPNACSAEMKKEAKKTKKVSKKAKTKSSTATATATSTSH